MMLQGATGTKSDSTTPALALPGAISIAWFGILVRPSYSRKLPMTTLPGWLPGVAGTGLRELGKQLRAVERDAAAA